MPPGNPAGQSIFIALSGSCRFLLYTVCVCRSHQDKPLKQPTILLIARYRSGEPAFLSSLSGHYPLVLAATRKEATEALTQQEFQLILADVPTLRFDLKRFWTELPETGRPRLCLLLGPESFRELPRANATLHHPISPRQLLHRLARLLPSPVSTSIPPSTLYLDGENRFLIWKDAQTPVTPKQASLVQAFLNAPGETLSRARLMQEVWGTDYLGDTRTLDVHIHWLREILLTLNAPFRLETRRGQGYCLLPLTEEK